MTDWDKIRNNISQAMEASEKFHRAGEILTDSPDQESIQIFANRLKELQDELSNILKLISPGSPVALDEIADAFSQAMRGKHANFRITPKPPNSKG